MVPFFNTLTMYFLLRKIKQGSLILPINILLLLNIFQLTATAQTKLAGVTYRGGEQYGSIFNMVPGETDFSNQRNFQGNGGFAAHDVKMVEVSNGRFFGMTKYGGQDSRGVLFEYNAATNTYITRLSFTGSNGAEPGGGLFKASNGKLYGMTERGGATDQGIIFEYDYNSNRFIKKIDMTTANGSRPLGTFIQAPNGNLLALTWGGGSGGTGALIEYDYNSNVYTKKIDFVQASGIRPSANLLLASNGKYYGLAAAGGTSFRGVLFEYDYAANTYSKKIDFTQATGATPYGSLVEGAGGVLYGMTNRGGNSDAGVIFSYNFTSSAFTKKIDLDPVIGSEPLSELFKAPSGKYYGLTSKGGVNGKGVLFEYDAIGNTFTQKINFSDSLGYEPLGPLMQATNGKLYAVTSQGGLSHSGVVFEFDVNASQYAIKAHIGHFDEGAYPNGGLVQASNGKLFGATSWGGMFGKGVIYEYDVQVNGYTKKIDLGNEIGIVFNGSFVEATPGKLIAAVTYGGNNGTGSILEYDYNANVLTLKLDLVDTLNGINPIGAMVKAANGKFYGTCIAGGIHFDVNTSNSGSVIFEYDYATNTYTKKIDLSLANGTSPFGAMVEYNGKLYGTTSEGGSGRGVLYEYDYINNVYTKKIDMNATTGSRSNTTLQLAPNGKMYGLAQAGGSSDLGTLFEYDPLNNICTKKIDFNGPNGRFPSGSMMLASNGKMYGVIGNGGTLDKGLVFEYDYLTNNYIVKKLLTNASGYGSNYGKLVEVTAPCSIASQPVIITNNTTVCTILPFTLSIDQGSLNGAANWVWYAGSCGGTPVGTGTSVNLSLTEGTTYYVRGEGGCAVTGPCGSIIMDAVTSVVQSVNITANTSNTVCAGTAVSFTATPINGGDNPVYQWKKNGVNVGTNSNQYSNNALANGDVITCVLSSSIQCLTTPTATSNAITFTVNQATLSAATVSVCEADLPYTWNNVAYTQPGTYSKSFINAAGCDSTAFLQLTVKTTPVAGIINNSGTTQLNCNLTAISVTATGGTAYQWSNSLGNNANASITAAGTYQVIVTSANGCTAQASITTTQNLSGPAAPESISGPVNVCAYEGTADVLTYTAVAVPGATSYQWTIPPTVNLLSGQGTNSITVTIGSGFTAGANKQLRVKAVAPCGTSVFAILYLAASAPAIPQMITGPDDVCPYLGTATEVMYSIAPVAAASGYQWTVPAGVTITENNGTSIKVTFATNFVTSVISIRSINNCGTSAARSITVRRVSPATPGLVTGVSNACVFIPSVSNPSGIIARYSVPKREDITTYNWTVPAGTSIVLHGSTDTTDYIDVQFTAGYSNGNITVSGSNNCGNSSTPRIFKLSRINPNKPGNILTTIIQTCPERIIRYSIDELPSNAGGLLWDHYFSQEGVNVVSGQGTLEYTLSFPPTANLGGIFVSGVNGCAISGPRNITVNLRPCAGSLPREGNEDHKKEAILFTSNLQVDVSPNPTTAFFNININSGSKVPVTCQLMDISGRILKTMQPMPGRSFRAGDGLRPGTYLLQTIQGKTRVMTKLVKL